MSEQRFLEFCATALPPDLFHFVAYYLPSNVPSLLSLPDEVLYVILSFVLDDTAQARAASYKVSCLLNKRLSKLAQDCFNSRLDWDAYPNANADMSRVKRLAISEFHVQTLKTLPSRLTTLSVRDFGYAEPTLFYQPGALDQITSLHVVNPPADFDRFLDTLSDLPSLKSLSISVSSDWLPCLNSSRRPARFELTSLALQLDNNATMDTDALLMFLQHSRSTLQSLLFSAHNSSLSDNRQHIHSLVRTFSHIQSLHLADTDFDFPSPSNDYLSRGKPVPKLALGQLQQVKLVGKQEFWQHCLGPTLLRGSTLRSLSLSTVKHGRPTYDLASDVERLVQQADLRHLRALHLHDVNTNSSRLPEEMAGAVVHRYTLT